MTPWSSRHPVLTTALAVVVAAVAVWGVKLSLVAASVVRYADYWSQLQDDQLQDDQLRDDQRQPSGGLLYVALGDSAAQGIGASRPELGYVGLLAQRLRERSGRPVQVVNLSRSGARIGDVLDRQLPALAALGRTPDVLTVAIGGNDVRAYDRATFAAEADRLVDALPDGAYVADAPYFMHGRWERDAQQAADLLTVDVRRRGLHPVPLHEALRAQGSRSMLTQFAADWFHPNDRGHRVWADAFWEQLRQDPVLSAAAPYPHQP